MQQYSCCCVSQAQGLLGSTVTHAPRAGPSTHTFTQLDLDRLPLVCGDPSSESEIVHLPRKSHVILPSPPAPTVAFLACSPALVSGWNKGTWLWLLLHQVQHSVLGLHHWASHTSQVWLAVIFPRCSGNGVPCVSFQGCGAYSESCLVPQICDMSPDGASGSSTGRQFRGSCGTSSSLPK